MADKKKKVEKKKEAPKILYHYCSNNAFHSIIKNHSIWLSSLSLSNDSMEGKLVAKILGLIAKDDGLDQAATDRLQQSLSSVEQVCDGLGFCLSEEGDLLSQWRGYADNATGVSVGFSKDYLEQFAEGSMTEEKAGFTLKRVEYDPEAQKSLIKPTYLKIKNLIEEGAFKLPAGRTILGVRSDEEIKSINEKIKRLFLNLSWILLLDFFGKLFLLKTNAFREEREWRLISYFGKWIGDNCSFRALNERIIPYREFKLLESESDSIMEVILGPKNTTPDYVINSLLHQNGFTNVNIKRSEASYR